VIQGSDFGLIHKLEIKSSTLKIIMFLESKVRSARRADNVLLQYLFMFHQRHYRYSLVFNLNNDH
jgi:hypothetical protein